MNQPHIFKPLYDEVVQVEINTNQTVPLAGLGNTPLIVLSRGGENPGLPKEDFERLKQDCAGLQEELAKLSLQSQHIIAAKSGHYIHQDQPELVVDAIRQLVEG